MKDNTMYLDEISKTFQEYLSLLVTVFDRLMAAGLIVFRVHAISVSSKFIILATSLILKSRELMEREFSLLLTFSLLETFLRSDAL